MTDATDRRRCGGHPRTTMVMTMSSKQDFTLHVPRPAHDTPKRRGSRTIYVDGPNGEGDQCGIIEVFGPDRDALTSVLLALFGAKEVEVTVETDEERDARIVAEMLGFSRGDDE
jgi:hypothetical protein